MPLSTITQLQPFNINSAATFTFANTEVTANISAGNIKTDNLLYANGTAWAFGSYSNTNVASYLPTYSGLISGTLSSSAQPNITSVGSLASLTVTGLITATAGGIKVGNLQDTSGTNTVQLTNSNMLVTGNISAGFGGAGNVTATYFIGNGSQLTGLPASYSNANVALYLPTYTGNLSAGNITTTGSGGNISGANYVVANYFVGNGSSLTHIAATNIDGQVGNSLITGTVYTNAQPNITSVGTLTSLAVTGNVTAGNLSTTGTLSTTDALITGNLVVNGTTITANVTTINVKDPIIEMGGNTSGAALTSNDGKDRGTLLHYYSGSAIDAFMGWDNSNGEFAFGSNVTLSSEVATFNEFGNVRAGHFIGNGSLLTGLPASYSNANVALYLPTYTGNFTAGNANVSGTLTVGTLTTAGASGNITGANYVVANYFIGNGSQLTGLPASYANANVETYLPTYTGNLSPGNLTVGTSANLGAVGNVIITGGSSGQVLSTNGSGSLSWTDQTGGGGSVPPASPIAKVDIFTADGTGNTYTLSSTPANEDQLSVNIDGVMQLHSSFSLSGNIVTLGGTPVSGAKVEITNIASNIGATTGKAIAMAIVFGF